MCNFAVFVLGKHLPSEISTLVVCEVRGPKEAVSDKAELKGGGVSVKSGWFRHLPCVALGSFSAADQRLPRTLWLQIRKPKK